MLNGQPLERKPGSYLTLEDGSVLETRAGRAEIAVAPGAWFRVGSDSSVRMLSNNPGDTRIEMVKGSAILDGSKAPALAPVTIIVGTSSIRLTARGEFRVDVQPARLTVHSGSRADPEGIGYRNCGSLPVALPRPCPGSQPASRRFRQPS